MPVRPVDVLARLSAVPAFGGLISRGGLVVSGQARGRVVVRADNPRHAAAAARLLDSSGFQVTAVHDGAFCVLDPALAVGDATHRRQVPGHRTSAAAVSRVLRTDDVLAGALHSGLLTVRATPAGAAEVCSTSRAALDTARELLARRGYLIQAGHGRLSVAWRVLPLRSGGVGR